MDVLRFVDTISASPTVRLNLNNEAPWATTAVDTSPPPLKQAWSGTLLADGERLSAAAYGNRQLRLSLELIAGSQDDSAAALQALWRELDRPSNLLMYQPEGATNPVFFRTLRSMDNSVQDYPGTGTASLRTVEVEIAAEPFAYGLKETLPQVTVYADPAEGPTLNENPFFETTASPWAGLGGSVARSTAQAHEGAASLLLTPDGVTGTVEARSENVSVVAGDTYRVSAWVRCAVSRTFNFGVVWRTAANGFISSATTPIAVTAGTWTWLQLSATAPVTTAFAQLTVAMPSTPPVGHTVHIDEARLRSPGGQGAAYFDVTGVKGDVETPLFLRMSTDTAVRQSLFAVRRRGTPSAAPFVLPAEAMSAGTDTALGASNDPLMSGAGQNYLRTSFATNTAMVARATADPWPATTSDDVRGTYRVFARVRRNTGSDAINLQLSWGIGISNVLGDVVALPSAAVTDPIYVDLGFVAFPVGQDPVTDGLSGDTLPVRGMQIILRAQRATGGGSLDIDHLVFVPADDRLMIATIYPDSGGTAQILDSARTMIYNVGAGGEVRPATLAQIVGGPPLVSPDQANRVVFLPNIIQSFLASITASTDVTPYYWPRYLHTRPVAS
ncbi:hypothetical protein GAR05_06156 [Micromonospora saelicesensis]|uniref:CBM-cenC domain-containing protein n=1 Tax=Micromonospora saelicesensis TaxID=285676 RepID=A0ABX9CAW0_9ACTN|nr:carbohydrate binding domain-containing protein [Micromonospora saelicesensis]RAN92664.1 hypothetical protein GAR05_06156 [Micromonospora saelicesensis]